MYNTLVINLFAGPGAGKSTLAATIFSKLKTKGISCELALEFAKDLVWEQRFETIKDQIYIFGKQYHRLHRLLGKVEVIITDSPILLSSIYDEEKRKELENLILSEFRRMNTLNFFIIRNKPYDTKGRYQTEKESIKKDKEILEYLKLKDIQYYSIFGNNEDCVQLIVNKIM